MKVHFHIYIVLVHSAWAFCCMDSIGVKVCDMQHFSVVTSRPRTSIIAQLCSLIRSLSLRC